MKLLKTILREFAELVLAIAIMVIISFVFILWAATFIAVFIMIIPTWVIYDMIVFGDSLIDAFYEGVDIYLDGVKQGFKTFIDTVES